MTHLLKLMVYEMHSYCTPLAPHVAHVIRYIVKYFLGEEYTHINIGATTLHANHDILQIVDVCEEYQKEEKLAR